MKYREGSNKFFSRLIILASPIILQQLMLAMVAACDAMMYRIRKYKWVKNLTR